MDGFVLSIQSCINKCRRIYREVTKTKIKTTFVGENKVVLVLRKVA